MEIARFFENTKGGSPDFYRIRKNLYEEGIKTSYEPFGHDYDSRMIFSLTGNANKTRYAHVHGLILNCYDWGCVVMPPPYFETKPITRIIDQNLADKRYDIIPAHDGSVMSLYWWNDSWRISSTKGYDMTDIIFLHSSKTCKQIFTEAVGETWESFVRVLDKQYSYSFVVTHSDIHLYWKTRVPNKQVFFVHRAARGTGAIDYICEQKIAMQEPVKVDVSTMAELKALPADQFPFGVILRTKDARLNEPDVFIESQLFIDLKNLLYNYNLNKEIDASSDRENYIALHAYLNKHHHARFKELFPQYSMTFEMISEKINMLVKAVMDLYSGAKMEETLLSRTAQRIQAYLSKLVTITKANEKIVRDYILDSKMTSTLYPFIYAV